MKSPADKKFSTAARAWKSKSKHSSPSASLEGANKKIREQASLKGCFYPEDEILLDLRQNLHHLEQKTAFLHFTVQEIMDMVR